MTDKSSIHDTPDDADPVGFPLSPAQEGMLMHSLREPAAGLFFQQMVFPLTSPDIDAFVDAWQRAIARHPILRASFHWVGRDRPVQIIEPEVRLPVRHLDWRHLEPHRLEDALRGLLVEDRRQGFDLTVAPLLRLIFARVGEDNWYCVKSHHHLILDGWSGGLVFREVQQLYARLRHLDRRSLPPVVPAVSFRRYIDWLGRQDVADAERFWRQELAGIDHPTPLPGDGTGSRLSATGRFTTAQLSLPEETSEALAARARAWGVTLGTLFQGVWAMLLSANCGERDVVFGNTFSGRPADLEGVEEIVGPFINVLPIRVNVAPDQSLADWFAALQRKLIELQAFQHTPLVRIQAWTRLPRGMRLFESLVILNSESLGLGGGLGAGSKFAEAGVASPESGSRKRLGANATVMTPTNDALALTVLMGTCIAIDLTADPRRVHASALLRLSGQLQQLLETLAAGDAQQVRDLTLLSALERQLVVEQWNQTEVAHDRDASLLDLVARQVAERPERLAVSCAGARMTYRELGAYVDALARGLARAGLRPGGLVGVLVERSVRLPGILLAILQAGCAYVPLDPGFPRVRLEQMLADSGLGVLLTEPGSGEDLVFAGTRIELGSDGLPLGGAGTAALPEPWPPAPHACAYVIYTSGSTGRPKGVMVPPRALVNFLLAMQAEPGIIEDDVLLAVTTLSFDIAGLELLLPLIAGARVEIARRDCAADPRCLARLMQDSGVTLMQATPATWTLLLEAGWAGDRALKVLCGGEALKPELARRLAARVGALWNMYGPTETTIWSSVARIGVDGQVTVGQPIANTRTYVLDSSLRPVPIGIVGELYIAGDGLALGYLGQPELSAERFVPEPFSGIPGARMYRTGDLARWLPQGELQCLGRTDHQVKIRGFRIELEDIESALSEHPGIAQAALTTGPDPVGGERLLAYVVAAGEQAPPVAELRAFLRQRLPEYMVPAVFVTLDALPLTANNKVNRRALPAPEASGVLGRPEVEPPHPGRETEIAALWCAVLGVGEVGRNDNFFELGGHSLLAMQVISRLSADLGLELPVAALFEAPGLAEFAARLELELARRDPNAPALAPLGADQEAEDALVCDDARPRIAPQSFSQQRLWFLTQLAPGTALYNTVTLVPLPGQLDLDALHRAVDELCRRQESFRTTFDVVDGEPAQVIWPPRAVDVQISDLRAYPPPRRHGELQRLRQRQNMLPFDLVQGPLARFHLARLDNTHQVVLVAMHHIVTDGWSFGVLRHELGSLYEAYRAGGQSPLPELAVQYRDYAQWQRDHLSGERLERQLAYWRDQLHAVPRLAMPTDRPRPSVPRYASARHPLDFDPDLILRLREIARGAEATLFMTLLAAFQFVLGQYSGQRDFCVGTPIANRGRPELEAVIGFFVNTLVMRADLSGRFGFLQLLRRTRQTCLDAYVHQDVPFEKLVETLSPERDLSGQPFFQVLFVMQNNMQARAEDAPGADSTQGMAARPGVNAGAPDMAGLIFFDLTLALSESPAGVGGALHYNTDLFDPETIARFADHFLTLLDEVARRPDRDLTPTALCSPDEKSLLLNEFCGIRAALPDGCVHEQIAASAARAPDQLALVQGDRTLSYAELEQASDQLARVLRARGIGPERVVGLFLERGIDAVIALLAMFKSGGVYLPLDPAQPPERLALVMEDARPALILTSTDLLAALPTSIEHKLCLDTLDAASAALMQPAVERLTGPTPDHLAYIIYTSGSTGKPKGVMIGHRALMQTISAQVPAFGLSPRSRVLATIALSFDASLGEILRTLVAGGTLYLAGREQLVPGAELAGLLRSLRITTLTLATPLLAAMPREIELPDLETLSVGGEALAADLASHWGRRHRLLNGYGPTETTIGATLAAQWDLSQPPPLGRPLANVRAYVLDPWLELVPVGLAGELYLGGEGLARGYLQRPDLTAERFIPDPFSGIPGARLYATGDRVRWRDNGDLQFLGRVDDQVKIRGYRIEPGEIAAVLREHQMVADAVVIARKDALLGDRLVAYVVPDTGGDAGEGGDGAQNLLDEWQQASEAAAAAMPPEDATDPRLNFTGWTSSYTGQPIPIEQMTVWAEQTVARIRALNPTEVLEIGCGTGLILLRLAPYCRRYLGVDFAAGLLEKTGSHLDLVAGSGCDVRLEQRRADALGDLADGSFDCVVINSVIQYFPNLDYLRAVLGQALRLVRDGGAVFVGDVRNFRLLEAFHASVQLERATATTPVAKLLTRIRRYLALERELTVDPRFFLALAAAAPRVAQVRMLPKDSALDNELNRFRYDVVLHLGSPAHLTDLAPADWLDWQWDSDEAGLAALRARLAESPASLGVRAIPNRRTAKAGLLWRWLQEGAAREQIGEQVGELRARLATVTLGVEPEELRALGSALGYAVELSWAGGDPDGGYDACFVRGSEQDARGVRFPVADADINLPEQALANRPAERGEGVALTAVLRDELAARLPDYMVPSAFVVLDALPLTAHGKLDRKALPPPESDTAESAQAGEYVAPRTAAEKTLASIWQQLLRLERVGIHDNFFDLGGDSILSIRAIARAADAGIELSAQDVYRFQTIAELAAVARNSEPDAALPAIETGPVPLTPIQSWFFTGCGPQPHHFNWATYLPGPPDMDLESLQAVTGVLARRHDALRLRFEQDATGVWQQYLVEPDERTFEPLLIDYGALNADEQRPAIEEAAAHLQVRFDLSNGPLARLVWFNLGAGQRGLGLLIVHHLLVDAISWGILVGELTSLLRHRRSVAGARLPAPSATFRQWAAALAALSRDGLSEEVRAQWLARARAAPDVRLPRDLPQGINSRDSVQHIEAVLPETTTKALLELAAGASVGMDTLLLAGLGMTLATFCDSRRLLIDIERHGREQPVGDLDVSRTLGWLSNIAPVMLDLSRGTDAASAFACVRAQLADMARLGFEYGLLRYMADGEVATALAAMPVAEVFFNYLGQQRQARAAHARGGERISLGPLVCKTGNSRYPLEINAVVVEERLETRWAFSTNLYRPATIEALTRDFALALRTLARLPPALQL